MGSDIPWKLIQNYLAGRASRQEIEQLRSWKFKDVRNEQLLDELQQIWSTSPEEDITIDTDAAWERLNRNYLIDTAPNQKEKVSTEGSSRSFTDRYFMGKKLLSVAAVILLMLIGTSYYIVNYTNGGHGSAVKRGITMKHLNTDIGERAEVSFTDGTRIVLNAASDLRFPRQFSSEQRVVHLNGEAYFEVASSKERPFIIKTTTAEIKVLGTKFNVQAWNEDQRMGVTVREGKVSVKPTDSSNAAEALILETKQRAFLQKGSTHFEVDRISNEKFLHWLDGGLYFHNTPFPSVINRLERRYRVNIKIMDEEISNYKYSGAFRKADLKEALDVLSVSLDVVFEKNENHISVRTR